MTTAPSPTAAAAAPMTRFGVVCPYCADEDAVLRIEINDLDIVTCSACEAEFRPAEAVAHLAGRIAEWRAVARWVALAPGLATLRVEPEGGAL